jgi:hypothetical protein
MVCGCLLWTAISAFSQQAYPKFNFNIGGGVGFPLSTGSTYVDASPNFVIGGGYNFNQKFGLDGEFMWQDLILNDTALAELQTSSASARQYAVTVDPIFRFYQKKRIGAYLIGGGGWYHRSGETTAAGLGVICDPFWSWYYGCGIGEVTIVTGSRSKNAFGFNVGGGLTYRLGEGRFKLYGEARYHHASYSNINTDILPLTFGIRF